MNKLMQSPFENDPFCMLFEAFKELYPEKAGGFRAIWNPDIDDGFGRTSFEDGEPFLIELSTNKPVEVQIEVFAYQLAHVVAGIEAEHGEEWLEVFYRIYQKYEELRVKMFPESDEVGEK